MSKLLDKSAEMFGVVKGIFNNTEPPAEKDGEGEEINTEEEQKLYDMAWYDYQVFRDKRSGMEDVWLKEQRMWKGDQWKDLRPADNGPYPERMEYTGNYAGSQIESIVARLTGWMPQPSFEPTEPGDEERAAILNAFIPYELNCIKFKQKHLRAVRRMVIHGPLIYEVTHDPTVEGGRGMNRWNGQNDINPVSFGSFFPDPAVKDFINLQRGRAHIINYLMTLDYVRERWEKQGPKVMPDNRSSESEIFDRDGDTIIGTSLRAEDNRTTVNVLRYMYKGKPKYMSDEDVKLFKEIAQEKLSEGIDPMEWEQKAKGEAKGIHFLYVTTNGVFLEHKSYVYDHGQYPIIARTLFPEEDNPWGKGYMRDLISPQTMYNRFCELAIEVTSKMGNSAIVYSTAAGISEAIKQIWRRIRGKAGAMLPVDGDVNQIKELQGVPPNPGIFQYIQHFLEMMQKIPGIFDSSNGASNPNVTSGRQSEALIAASQGRLSSAAELIEDAVQEVFEQLIELCAQHYTTERVARVTGKTVSFSRDAMVKQAATDEPRMGPDGQPMLQDMGGVKQPVMLMEEYMPKMDIKVSIGVEKPKEREYWIQTAFTLFQTIDPVTQQPMFDAEAVRYTVENGRMEPFSVIEERMQKEQAQMQKMQQLEQENAILNEQVNQLHGHLDDAQQNDIAGTAETLKQLNEGQKMDHEQSMKESDMAHRQTMDHTNAAISAAKVAQMGQRQPVGGGAR